MKILLLGGGGREHAICWKLAQSERVSEIHTIPGNPGTATVDKNVNVAIDLNKLPDVLHYAQKHQFDLTVVGPEKPLADGIVDLFQEHGLTIFGPTQAAARLESSKIFCKNIMDEAGIPTANSRAFDEFATIQPYLKNCTYPIVLKADGLASGKGVAICQTSEEAIAFASDCMEKDKFAASGKSILVEEFLDGYEVSFLVFACGTDFVSLDTAQDHKKLLNQDQGPNTGGMGAVSPAGNLSHQQKEMAEKKIIAPALQLLKKKGTPFSGILYAGLMITSSGPKLLEFNVRFGDPEAQVLLPRLQEDLAEIFLNIAKHRKLPGTLAWDPRYAVGVVLASEGYPTNPILGREVDLGALEDRNALLFHAGTERKDGKLLTSGGRVFTLTVLDEHLHEAQDRVYALQEKIRYAGKTFRTDIGQKLLQL